MVSFRSLVAGVALIAAPVMAAISSTELVERINDLAGKVQAVQIPVQSMTVVSAPLVVLGRGPLPGIITAGAGILSSAAGTLWIMDGVPQDLTVADADKIYAAFSDCVHACQKLLSAMSSKAVLVKAVPVLGGPGFALWDQFENFANAIAASSINVAKFWAEYYKVQINAAEKSDATILEKRTKVFVA
ncbi:hypothetical protein C7999DRAFT_35132 [Corynascus novoguineensis]|uniref:Uncharacterized protein n=1 Tax=Corynascus novoguineensis TaxID=1126955 RepID=A0AAN7CMJ4_9PEZI|nr:hypothetical protein C7999DRAFT_35132 [Corynascus novoguineensis]